MPTIIHKTLKPWLFSFLFACLLSHAFAAELSLKNIDIEYVVRNFPLGGELGIEEGKKGADIQPPPGCQQAKQFSFFEGNYPSEVIIAICDAGDYSPQNIQATLDNEVRKSKLMMKGMSGGFPKFLLAGLPGIPVALEGKRKGFAETMPAFGHGIGLLPIAYAIDEENKVTVLVQAYTDLNNPRNLNLPMAKLLQAIDRKLHETDK